MIMKNYLLLFFSCNLFFAACSSGENEKTLEPLPATDSVAVDSSISETIDTILTPAMIGVFSNSPATARIRKAHSSFDWSKFRMVNTWKEDTALSQAFNVDAAYIKGQANLLKYSPDSAYLLDLDSYAVEVKNPKQKEGINVRGPDTEVTLIDFANKTKIRLLFLGPAGSVEDGKWLDNDNILLLGMEERANDGTKVPVVWKYHVPTKSFYLFEYPEGIRYDNQ